ncbi:M10 family metallopeptidase C-terminal domain-containing protein [Gemmobacter caeruleus]|uniref:M10 family metallopeptidase C-terminal domain-containing protein n=1 Tax=Gemmobacter caeruleus TaxID=2595004 RepID=UPI0011EDBDF8|nr:M10 family metallopeptidase C-terminal domain-containing protein [Gemmobacter caeruleus]
MSSSDDRYKFTFDANGVATAAWEWDDGAFERDQIDSDESFTLYGDAVLHREHSGVDAEWAVLVQVPGSDVWHEVADGHGVLEPADIPGVLAGLGGSAGDDDRIEEGDVYRITFNADGSVAQIFEQKDDGREEREYISRDETYTVVGDHVVKVEADDDGPEWEIYAQLTGTDLWVEVADGHGALTLTEAGVAAAIAAEDGRADSQDDDDEYRGGRDDDRFSGGFDDDGDDCYRGGAGDDDVVFAGRSGVRVDLSHTGAQNTGHGNDRFISIEDLTGAAGDDRLSGNAGSNDLRGRGGDDRLTGRRGADDLGGGAGDDTLIGGQGADDLTGGRGADVFRFRAASEMRGDEISDFHRGEDHLSFRGLGVDFIARRAFSGEGEAELRFTRDADGVNLLLDRDGDGTADARLELHGLSGLGLGDLIL